MLLGVVLGNVLLVLSPRAEPLSPGAGEFDNQERKLAAQVSVSLPPDSPKFCAALFEETVPTAIRLRERFRLPGGRPWTLFTVGHCQGHASCEPLGAPTSVSAILYRGNPDRDLDRLLGLNRNAEFRKVHRALGDYLRSGRQRDKAKALMGELLQASRLLPAGEHRKTNPVEIWTAPIHGGRVTNVLLWEGSSCPSDLTRTGLIADDHMTRDVFDASYIQHLQGRPEDLRPADDLAKYGRIVARIEYLDYSRRSTSDKRFTPHLRYCSGLVLAPGIVLTAGHCVKSCAFPPVGLQREICGSYAIDFEYLSGGGPTAKPAYTGMSVPASGAIANAQVAGAQLAPMADYGFLLFDSSTVNGPVDLQAASPPIPSKAGYHIKQLAYPMGHFAQRGGCVLYEPANLPRQSKGGGSLHHTCYTLDGSSGGALFDDNNHLIGIHVNALRRCDGQADRDIVRAKQHEPDFRAINPRLEKNYCWGEAISLKDIFCAECRVPNGTGPRRDEGDLCDFLGPLLKKYVQCS